MPVKSAKQFRFMQHLKGMGGPKSKMASEFLNKTPEDTKSRFAKAYKKKSKKRGVMSNDDGDHEYR